MKGYSGFFSRTTNIIRAIRPSRCHGLSFYVHQKYRRTESHHRLLPKRSHFTNNTLCQFTSNWCILILATNKFTTNFIYHKMLKRYMLIFYQYSVLIISAYHGHFSQVLVVYNHCHLYTVPLATLSSLDKFSVFDLV